MKYYLYADGSGNNCSPYGEGGYAYIIADQNKNIISQYSNGELDSTNNTMELKAIIEGCKAIKEDNAEVTIISDSQYALNVLSGRYKAKVNLDLIQEHKASSQRLKLKYTWVKGHSGDKLNTMADRMARKEAVRMRQEYGIPKFDFRNSPKVKKAETSKKKKIKVSGKGSQTFHIHIEVALNNGKSFGAFCIMDDKGKELITNACQYRQCKTEPRLKLITLAHALKQIPQKANIAITPNDSYLKFAIQPRALICTAYNTDVIEQIAEMCDNLSSVAFRDAINPVQETKAVEALCSAVYGK